MITTTTAINRHFYGFHFSYYSPWPGRWPRILPCIATSAALGPCRPLAPSKRQPNHKRSAPSSPRSVGPSVCWKGEEWKSLHYACSGWHVSLLVVQVFLHGIRSDIVRVQCVDDLLIAQHTGMRLFRWFDLPDKQLA